MKPLLVIKEVKNFGPISHNKDPIELTPLTIFIGANNTGKSLVAKLLGTLILYKCGHESIKRELRLEDQDDLRRNLGFFISGLTYPQYLVRCNSERARIVIKDVSGKTLTLEILNPHKEIEGYYFPVTFPEIVEEIIKESEKNIRVEGNDLSKENCDVIYIPSGKALIQAFVTLPFAMYIPFIDCLRRAYVNIKLKMPKEEVDEIIIEMFRDGAISFLGWVTCEYLWSNVGALTARSIFLIYRYLLRKFPELEFKHIKEILREILGFECIYLVSPFSIPYLAGVLLDREGETEFVIPYPNLSSGFNEVTPMIVALEAAVDSLEEKKDFVMCIIVDEPEAHLHPEAQVKFAYKLVELVDKYKPRLFLLLSSHSDLFVQAILKRASELKILNLCRLYGFEYSEEAKGVIVRKLEIYEDGTFEPVEGFVRALEELFSRKSVKSR